MGPHVYDEDAKRRRQKAAESNIRSLMHYNNEVRRLQNEIEADTFELNELRQENINKKTRGQVLIATTDLEIKLSMKRKDLRTYEGLVEKVNDFLDSLDPKDKESIVNIYINNMTFANEAAARHRSHSAFHRDIQEILAKFY